MRILLSSAVFEDIFIDFFPTIGAFSGSQVFGDDFKLSFWRGVRAVF